MTNSDTWENPEIPLDANEERYQISIYDQTNLLVRQEIVSATGYTYPVSLRQTDLGGANERFDFSVAQLSNTGAAGAQSRVTVSAAS